jgi:hypothetical protein
MCSLYRREHHRTLSPRRLGHRAVPVMRLTWGVQRSVSSGKRLQMSALGQKQTCAAHKPMSALPPEADIGSTQVHVAKCQ